MSRLRDRFMTSGLRPACVFMVCLVIGFLSCPVNLGSDTIEMENGDTITGTIIQMNGDTVTIKAEYGTLVVKRKFIKKGLFATHADVSDRGLLLELTFTGNFSDSSGNRVPVKNTNSILIAGKDGTERAAAHSDGSGQYLSIESTEAFDILETFSISFWINPTHQTKSQYLISKWDSTTGTRALGKFAILYREGFFSFYVVDVSGAYSVLKSEVAIEAEKWAHAVFVCDRGTLSIHINGKKTGEKKDAFDKLMPDGSPILILTAKGGADATMSYYNLEGSIDSLRIYSRPLGDKEIRALTDEFTTK